MVPGSVYDRSGGGQPPNNNGMNTYIPRATANVGDPYSRLHDPIGYIAPERAQAALSAMPVPLGVFMNMTHVPPRFHGQQQQGMHGSSKSNQRPKDNARGSGPRAGKTASKGSSSLFTQSLSQNTQDVSTQPFSQGGMALTQGMSQVLNNAKLKGSRRYAYPLMFL
jgi:regulator of nonsense transcripts 1